MVDSGRDTGYVALRLILETPQITIAYADRPAFGQLNSVVAAILTKVASCSRVMVDAYICIASLKALFGPQNNTNSTTLARFKLNINVFGARSDSEAIGETLSDGSLFLQEPLWRTDKLDYHNPHIWSFEEFPEVDIWLAGLNRDKPLEEQMTAQQGWNEVLDELSSFKSGHTDLDVSLLTARLLKYTYLPSSAETKLTKFGRHQTDALGFMTDREIGRLTEAMSYWRSGTDEHGALTYVNFGRARRSLL